MKFIKLKDKLALARFNQVFSEPVSGKFHTPQEAKNVYLKGFRDGFEEARKLIAEQFLEGDYIKQMSLSIGEDVYD